MSHGMLKTNQALAHNYTIEDRTHNVKQKQKYEIDCDITDQIALLNTALIHNINAKQRFKRICMITKMQEIQGQVPYTQHNCTQAYSESIQIAIHTLFKTKNKFT